MWPDTFIKGFIDFHIDKLNLEVILPFFSWVSSTVRLDVGRSQVANREMCLGLFYERWSVLAWGKKGSNLWFSKSSWPLWVNGMTGADQSKRQETSWGVSGIKNSGWEVGGSMRWREACSLTRPTSCKVLLNRSHRMSGLHGNPDSCQVFLTL